MTLPKGKPVAIPSELDDVRERAAAAILPIKLVQPTTDADKRFLFDAKRTAAGRKLPPYYLVYFLLVDLLGFPNLGRFEKLAWSVPIDFNGVAFIIEHRKSGVGVFAREGEQWEQQAAQIVMHIHRGVKAAKPFFRWMAHEAVQRSKLNVHNVGERLFKRYAFLRDSFNNTVAEVEAMKQADAIRQTQRELRLESRMKTEHGLDYWVSNPWFGSSWLEKSRQASWLALAAIDAFYSWTEHIFIHLAILQCKIMTGAEIADLAGAEWGTKFKLAFDLNDATAKRHYDRLIAVRRQLRNFVAHGAFGKEGEAFDFHSNAGAVPVILDHAAGKSEFSLTPELAFDDGEALAAIEEFIVFLWSGEREPARLYLQEGDLPLILPYASDGTYKQAMSSVQEMTDFINYKTAEWDRAANMDW